jgi:hypothetical protein
LICNSQVNFCILIYIFFIKGGWIIK